MNQLQLTVRDILKKDSFKHAKPVAGENGLDRPIQWTHIIETKQFENLLNGGELVLTTGMNLDLENSLETFEKLVQKNVSGICIEIGPHFTKLSPALKSFADAHHFPVIVFEKTVKFVDITQKLHAFLINRHYEMLHTLNQLNKRFTELSLLPNGILKILQTLHHQFKQPVLFFGYDMKTSYYPPEAKECRHLLQQQLDRQPPESSVIAVNDKRFSVSPVYVLGQVWGYLFLQTHEDRESLNELTISVLDGAGQSIAQILLRNRTIEERKMNQEDEFVQNLLLGKPYNKNELKMMIPQFESHSIAYRVVLFQNDDFHVKNEDEWKEEKIQRALSIRSLLKKHGFFPAVSVRRTETAVICFFDPLKKTMKEKFTSLKHRFPNMESTSVGISDEHKGVASFSNAYKEANEVIQFNQITEQDMDFYEQIGVYRILFRLEQDQFIQKFVTDAIGPLLAYDKEMKTDLLNTLQTYLAFHTSKKETAERLHIVRQTLYHRLDRIQELLGEDYLEPENRLAIEIAMRLNVLMNY